MKPITLLLTSTLFGAASTAFAFAQEDGCSKRYDACMDRCAKSPGTVDQCGKTCEGQTDQCYVGMYGQPPVDNQASASAAEARDAQGSVAPAPKGR
jgi:hypothetical protein